MYFKRLSKTSFVVIWPLEEQKQCENQRFCMINRSWSQLIRDQCLKHHYFFISRFWQKYECIIHNNTTFSEKVPCCPHQKPQTNLFRTAWDCFACKLCFVMCIFLSWFGLLEFFLLEKTILWKEDSAFHFTESCGLLLNYCNVFISWLDSHSDGTHSLQMIHCWASDGMLHFYKSVLMKKNSSTSQMT